MMSSRTGGDGVDLWSQIIAVEEEDNFRIAQKESEEPQVAIVYRRKKPDNTQKDASNLSRRKSSSRNESRLSLFPAKRVSWNRSLSSRGRTSIAAAAVVDSRPQQRKPRRKNKPPLPKGKVLHLPNYDMERAYFQDVDSYELLEESPSPKKSITWATGIQSDNVNIPHMSSVLRKWLISRKLNHSFGFSGSLSKILETPEIIKESTHGIAFGSSSLKTPENVSLQNSSCLNSIQNRYNSSFKAKNDSQRLVLPGESNEELKTVVEECCEDIEVAVSKISLTTRPVSLDCHRWDPFFALLSVCGQSTPSTLLDVLSKYCDPDVIVKVGEGTYGEAFKVGETVCKIVPFNGDLRVNGEVQKKSEELLEEVVLSQTLNYLRGHKGHTNNACSTFIQTIDLSVCCGHYDARLIRAWEDWDIKHGSENDHPKEFPEDQSYVVFVQEHGGQDLESFVLLNFDEARSVLVQVTFALAVAEAAYEFEHRDLHWGNILLSRKGSGTLQFTLEGKHVSVKTFGLLISIIDFTLSRMNSGEDVLFMDLSSDPELFDGPKGDKQADTYRKMKEVTEECWEGCHPKTNVLWLLYLIDILLLNKSYDRTSKDERDLRSLKKHLNSCGSAKEAISDPFFSNLIIDQAI